MKLFLSPHSDDECLFGAYTILKEKPLVVVMMSKDLNEIRKKESMEAMKILGAEITFWDFKKLEQYRDAVSVVYAPALEGGNKFHDEVSKKAKEIFGEEKVVYYSTYRNSKDIQPRGNVKIEITENMKRLKIEALKCYKTQILATPRHFGLKNKDEYYI